MRLFIFSILMCVLFPSCVKKHKVSQAKNFSDELHSSLDIYRTSIEDCIDRRSSVSTQSLSSFNEAKLFDVPIPLQAMLVQNYAENDLDQLYVHYAVFLDVEVIINFYEREMERLGWQKMTQSITNTELLLLFDKPTKLCNISLRGLDNLSNGISLVIAVGNKTPGYLEQ